MLKKYKLFMFTMLLLTSCKRDKLYQLTENDCKYWDLNFVKSIIDSTKTKKTTISLKFCKNGNYILFKLNDGKRTNYKHLSDYQFIPKNKWVYENDTLVVSSSVEEDMKYTINKVSKNELVLKTEKGRLYYFISSK